MCVLMYVCMYVCVYVCMYVCMSIYVCVYVEVCMCDVYTCVYVIFRGVRVLFVWLVLIWYRESFSNKLLSRRMPIYESAEVNVNA